MVEAVSGRRRGREERGKRVFAASPPSLSGLTTGVVGDDFRSAPSQPPRRSAFTGRYYFKRSSRSHFPHFLPPSSFFLPYFLTSILSFLFYSSSSLLSPFLVSFLSHSPPPFPPAYHSFILPSPPPFPSCLPLVMQTPILTFHRQASPDFSKLFSGLRESIIFEVCNK